VIGRLEEVLSVDSDAGRLHSFAVAEDGIASHVALESYASGRDDGDLRAVLSPDTDSAETECDLTVPDPIAAHS
jgi:hypothetical protein